MLTHLQIRDFAIVEQLELEFSTGMVTITGETGAGKSIMIDALGLLLGDRADNSVIRPGAERAEISASFDLSKVPQARAWLSQHNLETHDDCHLRRLISSNGRTRAYINGSSQPLQLLRELGELLVDIHSQHEHQSLLQRELQRQLLDDFAANQTLLQQLAAAFTTWRDLQDQLAAVQQTDAERDARADLLRFQVQELSSLALTENEPAELELEQRRLANAGRLLDSAQQALQQLYDGDDHTVHSILSKLLSEFSSLQVLDDKLTTLQELISNALIQIEEAGVELRDYVQSLDLDPERRAWVEQRLSDVYTLSRKHRLKAEQLPHHLAHLQSELDTLDNSEFYREKLSQQLDQAYCDYQQLATQLSATRAKAATIISKKISAAMQTLGMPGGRFAVSLQLNNKPSIHGAESIEFMVSANPGQPLKPLTKVASGGELSRISLAIQVIAANSTRVPTLIFDEVDSGIGGGVAEVVGRQLRHLSASRQVLCVTHLAQVAAQAHCHYKVGKKTRSGLTHTQVAALSTQERTKEIARMLGGLKLTDNTLAHAQEMIDQAQRG